MGDIKKYLQEAQAAIDRGILPSYAREATEEVYLFYNREFQPLAIFKTGSKESTLCECMSYALDHKHFAGIPPTVEASFKWNQYQGRRTGSFQMYVGDGSVMGRLPMEHYVTVPAAEVRKIAILDIRLLNADRHEFNLIYEDGILTPIDHADVLKESCTVGFGWANWPQAFTPFSDDECAYISHLNPLDDYTLLLDQFKVSKRRASMAYLSTQFLKSGMECGLSAGEIGGLMMLRQYAWLPSLDSIFRRLLNEIQEYPMHRWDAHIRKAIREIATCV